VFYWRLLMYAVFTALLALTAVVFDYAKVARRRGSAQHGIGALIAAMRFIVRHPGRVAGVYALTLRCGWHRRDLGDVAPGAADRVPHVGGFAASQC